MLIPSLQSIIFEQ